MNGAEFIGGDAGSADDALNILVAAQRFGDMPALVAADRVLSFAQCAALVREALQKTSTSRSAATPTSVATVITGDITIASILAIYAALARHQPVGLIHNKVSNAQARAQQQQIEQATFAATTAVVVFTSGSTGVPRGVVLSRRALLAATTMSAVHLGWRADDRWALALSLAHVGGLNVVLRCLVAGKPVVLTPTLAALGAALQTGAVTLASVVPTQVQDLLQVPAWRVAPNVRALLLGGAAASQALLEAAQRRSIPLLTTYGASETCGQVVTAELDAAAHTQGVGVPLPGVQVQAGTALAPSVIVVRTPALFDGYLDDDRTVPRSEFTTSDLGFIATDGSLVVIGRSDDIIITGGEKVHPTAVEQVLLATPGVVEAVVFGVDDPRWGRCIGAALVVDANFDAAHAYPRWRTELAPFQRPRTLAIVTALPRTATGKVHRAAATVLPGLPIEY